MGFTREEIRDALANRKYNELTATYLLLGRKTEVNRFLCAWPYDEAVNKLSWLILRYYAYIAVKQGWEDSFGAIAS